MKTYRQSFWKTDATRTSVLPVVLITLVLSLLFINSVYFKAVVCCMGGMLIYFGFLFATGYGYVVITPRQLVIKNPFYSYYSREYFYSDIEKIFIGSPGGYSPIHMLVYIPGKRRKRFVIDYVNPKEFPDLVKDLEEKGVNVEVKTYGYTHKSGQSNKV